MSNSSNVTAISGVSSLSTQERVAVLQEQMALYTQMANGTNSQASTEYKTLQSALASGNVIAAEVALAQLQHTSETPASPAPATAPAASNATPTETPSPAPPTLNTIA